jgi:N6-adenosine-specific RNA methylase IME4
MEQSMNVPPARQRCGVANPKTGQLCVLDADHPRDHYDGRSFHWKGGTSANKPPEQKKPAKAKKPTEVDQFGQKLADVGYCGATFNGKHKTARNILCTLAKGHDGPHENTSIGVKEFRETAATTEVFGDDGSEPATSRKVHEADLEVTPPAPAPLTKIGDHEVHPAAAIFPMISGDAWTEFLDNIRTNRQRQKIVRIRIGSSWQILDGRNRLRACLELGVEPLFRDFGDEPGDGSDPIAFVISENIHRRHLDETARAFVGLELVPMYEAQARERQSIGGEQKGKLNLAEAEKGTATEHAARAVNVSSASIKHAQTVKRDAAPEVLAASRDRGQIKVSTAAELAKLPKEKQQEIIEKVGGGELRSGKVRAYVNQEKRRAVVRKINEQRVAPMPTGPFGVIYGDYPWHYDNSDQHEGSRGHLPYPTMEMDEIIAHALETAKHAAPDCILALWTTNLYITEMGAVLRAYGAERRTVFTWPKPRFGIGSWGRGQTEHLVIASIGSPIHTLNEVSTLLPSWAPEHPGEHSSKPAEVRDLLAKHCGGPFVELFARDEHENWAPWGAEVDKFKGAA